MKMKYVVITLFLVLTFGSCSLRDRRSCAGSEIILGPYPSDPTYEPLLSYRKSNAIDVRRITSLVELDEKELARIAAELGRVSRLGAGEITIYRGEDPWEIFASFGDRSVILKRSRHGRWCIQGMTVEINDTMF